MHGWFLWLGVADRRKVGRTGSYSRLWRHKAKIKATYAQLARPGTSAPLAAPVNPPTVSSRTSDTLSVTKTEPTSQTCYKSQLTTCYSKKRPFQRIKCDVTRSDFKSIMSWCKFGKGRQCCRVAGITAGYGRKWFPKRSKLYCRWHKLSKLRYYLKLHQEGKVNKARGKRKWSRWLWGMCRKHDPEWLALVRYYH